MVLNIYHNIIYIGPYDWWGRCQITWSLSKQIWSLCLVTYVSNHVVLVQADMVLTIGDVLMYQITWSLSNRCGPYAWWRMYQITWSLSKQIWSLICLVAYASLNVLQVHNFLSQSQSNILIFSLFSGPSPFVEQLVPIVPQLFPSLHNATDEYIESSCEVSFWNVEMLAQTTWFE